MKKILMMTILAIIAAMPAKAEQQVYSPYGQPTYYDNSSGQMAQQAIHQQQQMQGRNRIYPGREQYGDNFGNLPRHPGDYRDAVDRGQWSSGSEPGSRLFGIE